MWALPPAWCALLLKNAKLEADYIGREQGLLNDMIHSILEDANGLLWLGTNRGLIKFNPENSFSHCLLLQTEAFR